MDPVHVFEFTDYKKILQTFCRRGTRTGELKRLSEAVGVHASRLLRMIRGNDHPSTEQAYLMARHFQLERAQAEYFVTLVEFAKAGTPAFKKHLQTKLKHLKGALDEPEEMQPLPRPLTQGEEAVFHSSPFYFLVWLASGIEGANALGEIADKIGIPLWRVRLISDFLCNVGFCTLESGHLRPAARSFKIPTHSTQMALFLANWRMKAIERGSKPGARDLFYSSPMAVGSKAFAEIKDVLKQAIQSSEKILASQTSETLVCVNIDCFELGLTEGD